MQEIDLSDMTRGEVDVLLGYDFGQKARKQLRLDDFDKSGETVKVRCPAGLDAITPSFAQGFFGKSALVLGGRTEFYSVYDFGGWPTEVRRQLDAGITRALMDRTGVVD